MKPRGAMDDILVQARSALLDALTALREHRNSVVVIGAQAIYLHTGNAPVAVAVATKDSDLVTDRHRRDGSRTTPALERRGCRHGPALPGR
jgi:hypothetical protein